MTFSTPRRSLERIGSTFLILAAILIAVPPMLAQQPGEHWVGTWATAVVGRPQTPLPPGPPAPPPPSPVPPVPSAQPIAQPASQPPGPPAPFLHLNNQTL